MPKQAERRRSVRISVKGAVYGASTWVEEPLTVRDLSADGFSVESPVPFFVGARHQFEIRAGDGTVVFAEAKVVHCRRISARPPDQYVAGFLFPNQTPDQRAEMEALLGALAVLR